MEVPCNFELMGQTITVQFDDKLADKHDIVGMASFRRNEIILQPENTGISRNADQIYKTFYHELMHQIFKILNEHDLANNEKLIDCVAGLLYQYEKTKQGILFKDFEVE